MSTSYRKLNIYIGFLTVLLFGNCQKDDICPESVDTTPMLLINFYDSSTDEPRRSLNLTVREAGTTTVDTVLYRENAYQIALPLRTNQNSTSYEFVINAPIIDENGNLQEPEDSDLEPNSDIITFNYQREEEYLNRACSYKVKYLGLNTLREGGEDGAWIRRTNVVIEDVITDNLENSENQENEEELVTSHFNIFF